MEKLYLYDCLMQVHHDWDQELNLGGGNLTLNNIEIDIR